MKKLLKPLSYLLSISLLVPLCSSVAFSLQQKYGTKDIVTIFVDGINAENLINLDTQEQIFPPTAGTIVNAVVKNAGSLTGFISKPQDKERQMQLEQAVEQVLSVVSCDENGNPASDTGVDYQWQNDEEIAAYLADDTVSRRIRYTFDWRLDMKTLANQLHEFIEYILAKTGAGQVDLIGFSMGSCVVTSYARLYDYEYLHSLVILSGAYQGASVCGEPFCGKYSVDADMATRFTDSVLLNVTEEFDDALISVLMHQLNSAGITESILQYVKSLVDELGDLMFVEMMNNTLSSMPGMWALIPDEYYESAKALHKDIMTPAFEEKIDWYHDEVQVNTEEIISTAMERGIHTGIVCQYGYPVTPVIENIAVMSDSVIDTKYESMGATCADVGTTLGANYVQKVNNGHNCVSPDNLIDSSTCTFCDYTWFIKNTKHGEELHGYMTVIRTIMDADEQITVWSGEYPQYLIMENGEPVTQTAENSASEYVNDMTNETSISLYVDMMKNFAQCFRYTVQQLKTRILSFGASVKSFLQNPFAGLQQPQEEETTEEETVTNQDGVGMSLGVVWQAE